MELIDYKQIDKMLWDRELVSLLTQIYREVGRLEVYLKQGTEELEKMKERTMMQNIRSMHLMEKIKVSKPKLKILMGGEVTHNMDEHEVLGYIDAYRYIHDQGKDIEITPKAILKIHRQLYRYTKNPFAGLTKIMHDPLCDHQGETIDMPSAPFETGPMLEALCKDYREDLHDPLLRVLIFIYDFLCIYPFNDGNFRMSFLLLSLLLRENGFMIGDYISLEDKVYNQLDDYDQALKDAKEDVWAFVKYMLGIILSAYQDLEHALAFMSSKPSALEMVKEAISKQEKQFTKQDIRDLCPTLSVSSIEGGLRHCVASGEIIRQGNGKKTYYTFPLNENGQ